MDTERSMLSRVWFAHALYFVVGGIWSIVGRRSFEAITGPKTDYWLVRTVGGLLTAVGAVIGFAGYRQRLTPEIRWLAVSTSAVLAVIDAISTASGRLRRVYLLDALTNLLLIGGWLARPEDDARANRDIEHS
jgi:hypothetical protein